MICNSDAALYRFRRPIIDLLKNRKVEIVTVSSDTGYGEKLSELVKTNYNVNMYGNESLINILSAVLKVLKVSRFERPSAIHGFTHFGNLVALFAKIGSFNSNLVLTVTGMGRAFDFTDPSLKRKFAAKLILYFYQFASMFSKNIIVQNSDDFKILSSYVNKAKLCIQGGSGIIIDKNIKRPMSYSKIKVFMASRTVEAKGYLEFFKAAQFINSTTRSDDFEFIFAGGESLSEPFDSNISELATISGVDYLGYILNVEDIMSSCDVVVLPSYYREGVPRSLIEALYFDKFIITTNNPGCKETVIEGWNGYLVEPRNESSLISALLRLDNEVLNSSIGRSSSYCSFKFDGKLLAEDTYKMYT